MELYRYKSPKSSLWGHALRNMPAEKARTLLQQFLATAATQYQYSGGSLSFMGSDTFVSDFEKLLGCASANSAFHKLAETQCDLCLDAVAADEKSGGRMARGCNLVQCFTISAWRLPEPTVKIPSSELWMQYGSMPSITTFLLFASVADFQHVRKVFLDLSICNLNEKHLKMIRGRKAKQQTDGG